MSEIINLAKGNGDDHVYEAAAKILADKIYKSYSYVINVWNNPIPKTKFPIILISTSDETHQMPSYANDPNIKYIFKQYHPMQNMRDVNSIIDHDKVFSIPLCHLDGVFALNIPIEKRKYDWCWMGQFDPYRRVDFKNAVDQLVKNKNLKYRCDWYSGWNNGVSKKEYAEILNNTKIALVPCGSASYETFRFFEAMMCGCVIIGIDLPRVDFYNDASYFKINNWRDLDTILQEMHNTNLHEASEKSYKWYAKYCSPDGLASYMMSKMEKAV